MKRYISNEELSDKWWYRLFLIFKWLIIVASILVPLFGGAQYWYIDGAINGFFWYTLILIIEMTARYVAYGKPPTDNPKAQQEFRHKKNKLIWIVVTFVMLFLIVVAVLDSISQLK